jgi:hypothetical protein
MLAHDSHSTGVRGPGFNKIRSGMPILPNIMQQRRICFGASPRSHRTSHRRIISICGGHARWFHDPAAQRFAQPLTLHQAMIILCSILQLLKGSSCQAAIAACPAIASRSSNRSRSIGGTARKKTPTLLSRPLATNSFRSKPKPSTEIGSCWVEPELMVDRLGI